MGLWAKLFNIVLYNSGCTDHITHKKEWLKNLKKAQDGSYLLTVGGMLDIVAFSIMEINVIVDGEERTLSLYGIAYIPDTCVTLLSKSKLKHYNIIWN